MFKRIAPLPGRERPLLFAHRGLSAEAPENTMAAFRLARKYGIPGLELDIHMTEDGAIAVIHDDDTGRVSPDGRKKVVAESRMPELKQLDVGSWKGETWRGERIPVLAELFEEFGDSLYYDIEIKGRGTGDTGLEAALAELLADFKLDAESVVVSSFNPVSLRRFKVLSPDIPTGIIYCRDEAVPPYLRRGEGRWFAAADFLKPKAKELRGAAVRWSRFMGGRPIIPWTVDEAGEAGRLLVLGCQGIISNRPHELGLNTGASR